MKKYIIILIVGLSYNAYSQVGIGIDTPHASAILDFGTDADKGIVLPHVNALDAGTVPGTFYYDATTSKVMFKLASDVMDLSVKDIPAGAAEEFDVNSDEYIKYSEEADLFGVVMGEETTDVPGVLVLDTADKALALPVTDDFLKLLTPAPGTIVYDSTIKKLCVFDGEKWAFWGK